jgi:hypothetical protein
MPPRIYCQPELSSHRRPASHAFLPALALVGRGPQIPRSPAAFLEPWRGLSRMLTAGQTIVQGIGLLEGSVRYVAHDLNDLPHDITAGAAGRLS